MGTCTSVPPVARPTDSQTRPQQRNKHGVPLQEKRTQPKTDRFVPGFTTKTLTAIHAFVRKEMRMQHYQMLQIIFPLELIQLIYAYTKNNCTFILVFEHNSNPCQSYLHELDIESGTNTNLSCAYNHRDLIWKRVEDAAYCYGEYKDEKAIYRVGGSADSIVCTLRNGNVYSLSPLSCYHSECIYSRRHGLFVLGGAARRNSDAEKIVLRLDEHENVWKRPFGALQSELPIPCKSHLALLYESAHFGVSDKIFVLANKALSRSSSTRANTQCFDFADNKWTTFYLNSSRNQPNNSNPNGSHCGGCIDIATETLLIAGGSAWAGKLVREYNLEKGVMNTMESFTTYAHSHRPKVTKHNRIVVVFGNKGYSTDSKDYGYVEYLDTRASTKNWQMLSSLRELLEFTGSQVKAGFVQHMLQL